MRLVLAHSRYCILAKSNNLGSHVRITSWKYCKHIVGEQRSAALTLWLTESHWGNGVMNLNPIHPLQRASLGDRLFLREVWAHVWLSVSPLSPGTERMKKSHLCLHCIPKNHILIHHLTASSESSKVDSELSFTLTNLFDKSSQLHICPWQKKKKKKWSRCQIIFWQIIEPGFLFEPNGRIQRWDLLAPQHLLTLCSGRNKAYQ